MSNTWELMCIISHFNDRVKDLKHYSDEYKAYEELYAQNIRLQCKEQYGYVLTLDDFIENVRCTCFTDYDGHGYFLDKNGERYGYIRCDVKWLEKYKPTFTYVLWFNK